MAKIEKNSVKDIDGNTYNLVQIGTQIWTTENLTVSKYRNGDEIPQVQDAAKWEALKTGAWCYFLNQSKYGVIYGKLYNWYAINDSRGLAPKGFHIPSENEWTTLTDFLGGEKVAGGKLKEPGVKHWEMPNKGSKTDSGFKGLPGGWRNFRGDFLDINGIGCFWILSESQSALFRCLFYDVGRVENGNAGMTVGSSVRCIKD